MGKFRGYPKHLGKPTMRGLVQCDRSGFLRHRKDSLKEFSGSRVARDFADITPGFGTRHPQDVNQARTGGDPRPIRDARPEQKPLTKQDLCISDAEIELAVKENRPPREGF